MAQPSRHMKLVQRQNFDEIRSLLCSKPNLDVFAMSCACWEVFVQKL